MDPAFGLGADRLGAALAEAGLRDVAVREVVAEVPLPPLEPYADDTGGVTVPFTSVLATARW